MGQDKQAPKQETLHMPMKQHHSLSLLHFWHSAVINCIESDLLCSFLAVRSKGKLIDAALLKPGFLLAVTNMHNSQGMARMGFENNKEYLVWRFPGFPVKHLSSHYSVFHQLQQETYIHSISVYSMYITMYIYIYIYTRYQLGWISNVGALARAFRWSTRGQTPT